LRVAFQPHLPEIAGAIQLAVAPVFMLTAIGTLITALNNRLGRAVDRRRDLEDKMPRLSVEEGHAAREELATIARRIRFAYFAILSSVVSGLFVCLVIATVFFDAFVEADLSRPIGAMFSAAVVAVIMALLLFLHEIFLAVSTPRHIPR
jgi:hypothetical protein